MHEPKKCPFCELGEEYREKVDGNEKEVWIKVLMEYLEDYSEKRESKIEKGRYVPELFSCERGYHREDNLWFVTLAPEQNSYGHSLFILIEPYDDITDPAIEEDNKLSEIFIGLHRCSKVLKDFLGAEKVYVSSLCDGVEHLHFHLIPRYKGDPTDFGFMADRARQYDQGNLFIAPMDKPRRKQYFEDLAKSLKEKYTDVYGED